MLLLSRNVLRCDMNTGRAQDCWDTDIVYNAKGDLGGLTPKGHTKTHTTNNGEPAPIDVVKHLRLITQRL